MEESGKEGWEKTKENLTKLKDDSIKEYTKYLPYILKYGFLILILIPLFLNMNLRLQTLDTPIADNWARDSVINNIQNQVKSDIDLRYPNLPVEVKDQQVAIEVNKVLSENQAQLQQSIKVLGNQFRDRMRDDNGYTYFLAIDPFFWARNARNIVDHGFAGDYKEEDGTQIDDHMLAPIGREIPADMFHAYFEAYLFNFVHFFNKDITLQRVAFITPAIIIGLAVIIAFFLGRKIAGNMAGFFAATLIAIHNSILVRTMGGFADTDAYQVFFPLLIVLTFFYTMDSTTTLKRVLLSILTGFLMGFYSFVWGGWWYISFYIFFGTGVYLAYLFIHALIKKEIKGIFKGTEFSKVLFIFGIVLLSTIVFLTLFSGFREVWIIPIRAIGFIQIHEVAATYVWPNVFITVAEQNEGSIAYAISQVGGTFLFYFALTGLIIHSYLKYRRGEKINIMYSIVLILWIITTTWAVTRGVRFTLMLLPAFAIAFGVAISLFPPLLQKLFRIVNLEGKWHDLITYVAVVFIGLLSIGLLPYADSGMWSSSKSLAYNSIPSMNDAWWNSLEKIKFNSSRDAIITSWWDFGHWFKYIADRRVTFDGTSQNTPQAHWVGKILATDNEREAVGILRMLDCGGSTGFEKLDETYNNDIAKTIELINPMLLMNREEAKQYLLTASNDFSRVPNKKIEEILDLTHCEPPEAFFIASSDMVGKAGVWTHFGLWDFNRSLMYHELIKPEFKNKVEPSVNFLQSRFGLDDRTAENIFYQISSFTNAAANSWISPFSGYATTDSGCTRSENGTLVTCPNQNIRVNFTDNTATINERTVPHSLIYITNEGTTEVFYDNPAAPFSIAIYNTRDGKTRYLLAHESIANSMFTRMFFMNGHGLKYFKSFSYEKSFNNAEIYIYKVDWDKLLEEENEK